MRYMWILTLLIIIFTPSSPAMAYTELAEDFLRECCVLDRAFPPEHWSDEDLRSAAIEVLDSYEATGEDEWAVYFCLKTLGHTREPVDIPRILEYEDTMTGVVIRSLRGFPAPDAIECLLRWVDAEKPGYRELSVKSLAEIDFKEVEDAEEWRDTVLDALYNAKDTEEFNMIGEVIDEAILEIESRLLNDED